MARYDYESQIDFVEKQFDEARKRGEEEARIKELEEIAAREKAEAEAAAAAAEKERLEQEEAERIRKE